jgi:hypothetical protein
MIPYHIRIQFHQSQNFIKLLFHASRRARSSRPALPPPCALQPCLGALKAHSLDGLEGLTSGASYGDDAFMVLLRTGQVGLGDASCTRCATHDVVGLYVTLCGSIVK